MKVRGKARSRLLLLGAVVLGILGSVGGAYGYRRVSLHREQQAWKADGIAASRAGDHGRAVEMLTRYLHARADDVDALRAYAESRQAASSPNDAQAMADVISVLRSLSQLAPLRENEQRMLLQLYARSGNDTLAAREADQLLAAHPRDAEALHYKAVSLFRQRDFASAAKTARQWADAAPDDLDAECVELSAMRQSGAAPRDIVARPAMLRRSRPNDARFELLESIALTLTGLDAEPPELAPPGERPDTRTAADWARQAAAHAPPDWPGTRMLGDQLNRLELFDDALAVLQKAAAAGAAGGRRDLARRLWESGQWASLAQLLEDEPKAGSKADAELLYLYWAALTRLNRGPQAARVEADLSARGDDPLAKAWLLQLNRSSGVAGQAPRQQVECFESALGIDPSNPYLQYYLAEAWERLGETDQAIQGLEAAASLSATWAAAPARLAGLLLARGRIDAALRAADRAMKREFRDGQIHDLPVAVILCRVWLAALTTGRSTDAAGLSQLLDAVQRAAPDDNETIAIRIALLVRANDRAGAAKMLSGVIQGPKPLSESTLLSYAALSQGAGLGLEPACLDRDEREHGMTPDLAFARASAAMAAGGPARGLERFDAEYARHHDPANAALELVWQVSRAHFLDAAADPAARAAWIALGDAHPDALGIQQMTLAAPAARADREFTDRTIERARKLTGEAGIQWRLARARWLLDPPGASRTDIEAATRLLGAVIRTCPQCAEARLTLASGLERLQQADAAIEQLQAAVALMPDSLDPALQLVGLLEQRGDSARAEVLLRRFTDGPLANPNSLAVLSRLQEHEGNLDGALTSIGKAIALDGNNRMLKASQIDLLIEAGRVEAARDALAQLDSALTQPTEASRDTALTDRLQKMRQALNSGKASTTAPTPSK